VKLLLDTCCIIWAVSDPSSLSAKATDVLEREDSVIFVSSISCAEIARLSERGRIELDQHWKLWFNYYLELNRWQIKNIDLSVIQEAYSLPDCSPCPEVYQELYQTRADRSEKIR